MQTNAVKRRTKQRKQSTVTFNIGIDESNPQKNGAILVRFEGKHYQVMFYHDYLNANGKTRYSDSKNKAAVTSICGRQRFSILVCLSTVDVPKYISDENGIFEVYLNNRWRKCQFVEQYREQHMLKSKQLVQWKIENGSCGLQQAIWHRNSTKRHIKLVVLPK